MKYLQSVFCWLGIGLIVGMMFLVLQQTSTVPITWVRLSLLAVPASYAAIGLFGLILDSALGNFPAEDKNYQWLVYFYPLLFLTILRTNKKRRQKSYSSDKVQVLKKNTK